MNQSPTAEMRDLAEALRSDRERLPHPGHEPLWAALSDRSMKALAIFARRLERTAPEVYGLFGTIDELQVAISDAFDRDEPMIENAAELAAALETAATGHWLVSTPIINLQPPARVELLDGGYALAPTLSEARPDWTGVNNDLERLFGKAIKVGWRIHNDMNEEPVDCRHTASLVSEERGSRTLGEHRALVKAQYILATWTLLSEPHHDTYMALWPVATEWVPQPHFHLSQRSKPLQGDATDMTETGQLVVYAPDDEALYQPPIGPSRAAPVRAIQKIGSHRPPAPLLSAAWNLYLAARPQTDLQWIDRLLLVIRAKEALCDPPPNSTHASYSRWKNLSANLRLDDHLIDRGFDAVDIQSITHRAWDLRNLGTHSADTAAISLGWSPNRDRLLRGGGVIRGTELAPLHIREGIEAPFAAIHFAAKALWERMLEHDFNDDEWERMFTGEKDAD